MDTFQQPNSLSDHDITLIATQNDLKKYMSQDTSRTKKKNSLIGQIQFAIHKLNFQPIPINSYLHQSFLSKTTFKKHNQIQFVCFEDRKVFVDQVELRDWQNEILFDQKGRDCIKCYEIIDQVIKKLCLLEYNFEPLHVRVQTFQLQIQNNLNNKLLRQCINNEQITYLINNKKIYLKRSSRRVDQNEILFQNQKEVKQQVAIEVLSPDKRDIVECIDKNKTVAHLKQKIAAYYYQIVGQVRLLSYNDFREIDNQTKISELTHKVLQIYQPKHQHIDPCFMKRAAIGLTSQKLFQIVTEQTFNGDMEDTFVSEDWLHGKLYLKIQDKKVIQRYSGGVVGYLQGDRCRTFSLITLTGVKITQQILKLEFESKQGPQVIIYNFENSDILKEVVSHILTVTRIFNHLLINLD